MLKHLCKRDLVDFLAEQPHVCAEFESSHLSGADGDEDREASTYTCSGYEVTTTSDPTTRAEDFCVHASGVVAETLLVGIATRSNLLPNYRQRLHNGTED